MKNVFANNARRVLIRVGKSLPFILCFIVLIAYTESAFALATSDFLTYNGYTIPNTPISFYIANNFAEYDFVMCVIVFIISIAIEACKWNLRAIYFLFANQFEKYYFDFELEPTTIYLICFVNIIVASYLIWKGFSIFLHKT